MIKFHQILHQSFLSRISSLIVIQVLFVFAALFFIILNSSSNTSINYYEYKSEQLMNLPDEIQKTLSTDKNWIAFQNNNYTALDEMFSNHKEITKAHIFINDDKENLYSIYSYNDTEENSADNLPDNLLRATVENLIDRKANNMPFNSIPTLHTSHSQINFIPLKLHNDLQTVVVVASEHDYLISNRTELSYAIFMLFLVSTLISLLTIYLISKRFKDPLNKLIYGFEKTAKGELYKLIEPVGDLELQKLAQAYNGMSKTLWDNLNRLQKSNRELEASNQLLFESRSYLSALIEKSPDAVIATDNEYRITLYNKRAEAIFEYQKNEIIGEDIDKLFSKPISEVKYDDSIENKHGFEFLAQKVSKELFPVYCVAAQIKNDNSDTVAYLYILRDISESKSFQDMMIRMDRYYTRGEMAGDIAHEINNYLAVLSGNLELMPLFLKKGQMEKITQKNELMRRTVDNIARFANGLMDPNQDDAVFIKADINQLLETVIAFLKPQNKFDNIEFVSELSTEMPLIEIDLAQIQQLIINFVYNSAEAIKSGGEENTHRITIKTLPGTNEKEETARIEICDNGPGVQKDKEEILFKKRFTTKRKGHGIGLITCQKIVEGHRGEIGYVYDNGAKFFVELPVKQTDIQNEENFSERKILGHKV